MQAQAAKGVGVPLALDRPETKTEGKLSVSSSSFDSILNGRSISATAASAIMQSECYRRFLEEEKPAGLKNPLPRGMGDHRLCG